MRTLMACLASVLLLGCAVPLHEQRAALDRAIPCCTGFDQIKYPPLSLPSENTVELKNDSPTFVFKHGKSFFAAYSLPRYAVPYTLSISHQPLGTAVSPMITLLDENFAITREFDRSKGRSGTAYRQILDVFINGENQNERYLLISARSSESEGGLVTKSFTPLIIPIGTVGIVANGREHVNQMAFGPMGTLSLSLSPYQPTVVGGPVQP